MLPRPLVVLISSDAELRGLVRRHQPADAELRLLTPEEATTFAPSTPPQSLWIDLDTATVPAIQDTRRVYFHTGVLKSADSLPPGIFIRRPFVRNVLDVLWSRSVGPGPNLATTATNRATASLMDASVPAWLLEFHELELKELCRKIVADLPRYLHFRDCTLYLHDADARALTLAETTEDRLVSLAIPIDDPRDDIAAAARSGAVRVFEAPQVGSSAVSYPVKPAIAERWPAVVAPLISREQLRAVIVLSGVPDGAEIQPLIATTTLEPILRFLARTIEHAGSFLSMRTEARIDPLTRLPNRRWLFETLENEIRRVERYQGTFSVLMVDLDGMKRVNDAVGHNAGDSALRHIANLLRDSLRQIDGAARVGGDEFLILLPGTSIEGAREVAKRVRSAVGADSPSYQGATLPISVSIGAAEWRNGWHAADVVEAADRAMYVAKNGGRSGVAYASEDAGETRFIPEDPTNTT